MFPHPLCLGTKPSRPEMRPMGSKHLVLGGWGVAPEAVHAMLARALPRAEIVVLPPTRAGLETALGAPEETRLLGWSLGARLLLEAVLAGKIPADRRVTLVCPFLGFPSEAGQGGRVAATQVKFLRRWLTKDARAALADFYQRAGLNLPAPESLPYSVEELDEGLGLLADTTPPDCSAFSVPGSAFLFAGARDPLLDNTRLAELLPGLRVLPDAGHDLADFVQAIATRD
jgi:hypothetical protein